MGHKDGVLFGLESRQMVDVFHLRFVVNNKRLISELYKVISHSGHRLTDNRLIVAN